MDLEECICGPVRGSLPLFVRYNTKIITNGSYWEYKDAKDEPMIYIGGGSDDRFTLVMTDVGSPNEYQEEWPHWIVANIPGSTDGKEPVAGRTVLPYQSPGNDPEGGIRRYEIIVFEQSNRDLNMKAAQQRSNFSTSTFAMEHSLGDPVVAYYFYCKPKATNDYSGNKEEEYDDDDDEEYQNNGSDKEEDDDEDGDEERQKDDSEKEEDNDDDEQTPIWQTSQLIINDYVRNYDSGREENGDDDDAQEGTPSWAASLLASEESQESDDNDD